MRCQKSSIYFGPWPAHGRSWLQERNPHSIQDAVGALSAHINPFGMPNSSRHVSIFPVRKVLMACEFLVNVMLAWVREAPTLPAAVAKRKPAPWGSKKLNCFSPNAFGQKKGMNAPLGARFARPFCVCVRKPGPVLPGKWLQQGEPCDPGGEAALGGGAQGGRGADCKAKK